MTKRQIDGIFLLDKPLGLSSNQALQKVKRIFNAEKAGHTGTLDPLATGMLPILFGQATKFAKYLLEADKCYQFTMALGTRTATGDSEGEVIEHCETIELNQATLHQLIQAFQGKLTQIPPKYSAIKVDGKPLYKYARNNEAVEIKAREIIIHKLQLLHYENNTLEFEVTCSKGTYIRSLAEDMAVFLGMVAHVTKLRRIATAPFNHSDKTPMILINTLTETDQNDHFIYSIDNALIQYNQLTLNTEQTMQLYYGLSVNLNADQTATHELLRLYNTENQFIGLGTVDENYVLKSVRLMQPQT